ncbi:TetR/AcrR family transcriptional regulator [Vibrio rhodolitus]|uniref:TetR/AcrR family transcriptional regulator n=1 Tax=Vibrio rhodolitus TaxID=2231649 RepID=UPI000E0A49F5|nr:TetR/AcrR family transcriptional regulator [Vibrio rhodolitus]
MSVKNKSRGRPSGVTGRLNRDSIMIQAKRMMLDQGKVPSIRNLAAELDVDAMAIYHYYANKNDLLESITVSLIDQIYQPQQGASWQQELNRLAWSYLELLQRYSGLLDTLLSMKLEGPANRFEQHFNAIVDELTLPEEHQQNALHLLVDYLHGVALAMKCNQTQVKITLEMIEGPLNLICDSIYRKDV